VPEATTEATTPKAEDRPEPTDAVDEAGTTLETEAAQEPAEPDVEPEPEGDGEAAADEPGEDEPAADEPAEDEPAAEPRPYVNPLVEILRAELASKDEQLRGYITAYKEATQDMERERERVARHRETVLDRDRMGMSGSLLDVLDNLDRSLAGCTPGADPTDILQGLQLVRDGFVSALGELGVERTESMGSTFDANLHEATAMIPAQGDQGDQEIVFEERPGYTFKGKLLRAARVIVASRPD
jgi:molecular chaperone GrpE